MREIKELRGDIDEVDKGILRLLEKRVKIAKKIGAIKRRRGLPIKDHSREEELVSEVTSKTSLDQKFVKKIFKTIIDYCREHE
jgi:chorismate mutase